MINSILILASSMKVLLGSYLEEKKIDMMTRNGLEQITGKAVEINDEHVWRNIEKELGLSGKNIYIHNTTTTTSRSPRGS